MANYHTVLELFLSKIRTYFGRFLQKRLRRFLLWRLAYLGRTLFRIYWIWDTCLHYYLLHYLFWLISFIFFYCDIFLYVYIFFLNYYIIINFKIFWKFLLFTFEFLKKIYIYIYNKNIYFFFNFRYIIIIVKNK